MRVVGFTGSQTGATQQQRAWLRGHLIATDVLHHGACIGADETAHALALELGLGSKTRGCIVVHPPKNTSKMMARDKIRPLADWSVVDSVVVMRPGDYLARDRDIVDASDVLLALPSGPERMRGSGTWYTIRYAVKQQVPVLICWPDGRVDQR